MIHFTCWALISPTVIVTARIHSGRVTMFSVCLSVNNKGYLRQDQVIGPEQEVPPPSGQDQTRGVLPQAGPYQGISPAPNRTRPGSTSSPLHRTLPAPPCKQDQTTRPGGAPSPEQSKCLIRYAKGGGTPLAVTQEYFLAFLNLYILF